MFVQQCAINIIILVLQNIKLRKIRSFLYNFMLYKSKRKIMSEILERYRNISF